MGKFGLQILFYTISILMLSLFIPCSLTMKTSFYQEDTPKNEYPGNIRSLYAKNSAYNSIRVLKKYIEAVKGAKQRSRHNVDSNTKISHVILNNTGRAYLGLKQVDKALEYFHKSVEKYKNYKYPYANIGAIYIRQGRYEDAIWQLRKAQSLDENYVYALSLLGDVCLKQGDYERSLEYVDQVLESESDNIRALITRTWIHILKGSPETAVRDAEKAVTLNPDSHKSIHALARSLMDMGKHDRALETFTLLGDSTDPMIMIDQSLANYYLGDFDRAINIFNKILQIERDWDTGTVGSHYQKRLDQLQSNIEEQLTILQSANMISSGKSQKSETEFIKAPKLDLPKLDMKDVKPPEIIIFSHDTTSGRGIAGSIKKNTVKGRAIDENGISEIRINNKIVKFDLNGAFSEDLYLEAGRNSITVTATDRFRNTAIKKFAISLQEQFFSWENAIRVECSGNYYALIIGNDNYKYIRPLQTAAKDAYDINLILQRNYAFKTKLLINATRAEILDAINYYRTIAKENDKFLIYYAGHSVFDKLADKAYWLPVNALADNDTHWIIIDAITSNIRRFVAKHILIVTDSCYSGTFTRRSIIDMHSGKERNRYLHKMLSKASRTLMASGGNEPVSDLSSQGNSVFARAFITGLQNMERKLFTAEELFYEYIKECVAGSSYQTPEYNVIRNSGHNGGDFPFWRVNQ